MPLETVTVVAGNSIYTDWETVVIEQELWAGHVNCLLTTTEVTPIGAATQSAFDKWAFPPGTAIEVYANDDIVFSGFVWQYAPAADAEQHSITLYCKSTSYNFEVSTILSQTGNYENTTVAQIIQGWAAASQTVLLYLGNPWPVDNWQIRQGATHYEEALRLIKPRGMHLFGLREFGGIAVSSGRALGVQGPLVQGENILRMAAKLTDNNYEYTEAVGQHNIGVRLKEHLQIGAQAMGFGAGLSTALGSRRKTLVEPVAFDPEQAALRAMYEVRRANGADMQAVITVPGWHAPWGESYVQKNVPAGQRQEGMGPLWICGADTYIYAPWLKINCVMRTQKVIFKQSLAEGSTTELTLINSTALGEFGEAFNSAICKNGGAWSPGFDFGDYMPGYYEPVQQFMQWFDQYYDYE